MWLSLDGFGGWPDVAAPPVSGRPADDPLVDFGAVVAPLLGLAQTTPECAPMPSALAPSLPPHGPHGQSRHAGRTEPTDVSPSDDRRADARRLRNHDAQSDDVRVPVPVLATRVTSAPEQGEPVVASHTPGTASVALTPSMPMSPDVPTEERTAPQSWHIRPLAPTPAPADNPSAVGAQSVAALPAQHQAHTQTVTQAVAQTPPMIILPRTSVVAIPADRNPSDVAAVGIETDAVRPSPTLAPLPPAVPPTAVVSSADPLALAGTPVPDAFIEALPELTHTPAAERTPLADAAPSLLVTTSMAAPAPTPALAPVPTPSPTVVSTPAPPPGVTPTTDDGAPLVSRLVETMRWQAREGGGQVEIRLRPEVLGAVTVSLVVRDGVVKATVVAESAAARAYLQGEVAGLEAALEARGLTLEHLDIREDALLEQRGRDDDRREPPPERQAPARLVRSDDAPGFSDALDVLV